MKKKKKKKKKRKKFCNLFKFVLVLLHRQLSLCDFLAPNACDQCKVYVTAFYCCWAPNNTMTRNKVFGISVLRPLVYLVWFDIFMVMIISVVL